MFPESGRTFCEKCRKFTTYTKKKEKDKIIREIDGKEYAIYLTVVQCSECGAEINPPGLIDENIREMKEQYKKYGIDCR